jgi:hypothetical protein
MCTNLNGARKVLPGHPIKDCFVLKDKIQKKKGAQNVYQGMRERLYARGKIQRAQKTRLR